MQQDVIRVARKIEECIQRLGSSENVIRDAAAARSVAVAEYDRDLGLTLVKLRNGATMDCDGEAIKDPPASTSEKIAKAICWESRLALEQADAHYKVSMSKLDGIKAQLMGWQSVNKRLDNV